MIGRIVLAAAFALPLLAVSSKQAVIGSQHDLTATGGGPIRSTVTDTCNFCHSSHNVVPNVTPLWDQRLSVQTYLTYTSTTYNSGLQTPATGTSKLCLSCHDGTVAPGITVALGTLTTSGSMKSTDILGTNLATGHPMSMIAADDGQLAATLFNNPPVTKDPTVQLVSNKTECTTCHDPHVQNNDPATPMFLVRRNSGGALCLACHDPSRIKANQTNALLGWNTGSHAIATNTVLTTAGVGPYGNVAADACAGCHGAHQNLAAARDLKAAEEGACSPCHSGANVTPALPNITAEYGKAYAHPTLTVSGAHDPAEAVPVNNTRHAECADCHNSHAAYAQTGTPTAPGVQAEMAGVSGLDTSGPVAPATTEFQVCFKCHADSTNKPATSTYGRTASRYPPGPLPATYTAPPPKPSDQYNVRLKFIGTIGHNVMGTNIVTTANASLRPFMLNINGTNNTSRPLTTATLIYCSDCHNNDQARSSGGTGPNGAHGSIFPHLLERNFGQDTAGANGGGGTGSALCNKCHNVTTLINQRVHNPHSNTSCSTCHDPHGVIGGNVSANHAMVNFDTAIVTKTNGTTGYYGHYYTGATKGCYTVCHGQSHNPQTY